MRLLSRTDFNRHINTGRITDLDALSCWVKPTGEFCLLRMEDGVSCIYNGNSTFYEDELSEELTRCGILGPVIIHHKNNRREIARWLSRSLISRNLDDYKDEIVVYTFRDIPDAALDCRLELVKIHRHQTSLDKIDKELTVAGDDDSFDGLIVSPTKAIEMGTMYHLLPKRTVVGKIVSVFGVRDENNRINAQAAGLIIRVHFRGKDYYERITNIPYWVKDRGYKQCVKELIGCSAQIEYTMFIPGDRLKNFSSAIVKKIEM